MPSDSFKIAIIGKTNVGKSTLFNRILGKRVALVFDRRGVTRDSKEAIAEIWGKTVLLIDAPGMFDYEERDKNPELTKAIFKKTNEVIASSDLILFVIDVTSSLTERDREIANSLRKTGKKVIVVVNKSEKKISAAAYLEAMELGFEDTIQVSAEHGIGIDSLFEIVYPKIIEKAAYPAENDKNDVIKLAFIGKPNVGKSSIVNKILGEDRQLVADFSGLTRESSEYDFEFENRKIKIIDTPGLRRKSRIVDALEKISSYYSINSYKNADIVILLIDASSLEEGKIEKQDLTIASNVIKAGKVLTIAFNKCDKVPYKNNEASEFLKRLFSNSLSQLKEVPFLFVSALNGTNVTEALRLALSTFDKQSKRIKTSDLNDWVAEINKTDLLQSGAVRFKLKYASQVKLRPPTFVIFVSNKNKIKTNHERFIINSLKKNFSMSDITIRTFFKENSR